LWADGSEFCSTLLIIVLMTANRRHRVEAEGLGLSFRPLARLAQNEEPGLCGGEAREAEEDWGEDRRR
jgi:hypothetical protein